MHSSNILRDLMELIVSHFTPTLDLAEVEGDAVFAYVPEHRVSRGELLLEVIEVTYAAFRDRQSTMEHNATCPCKACHSISNLDLKFITHHGDYILQEVASKTKPVGSSVNAAHRLLKNNVGSSTGWSGYALFSQASLRHMNVHPVEVYDSLESYEHIGEINTSSINLDERYQELIKQRKVFLSTDEADISVPHEFAVSPSVLWDWLNDPHKRTRWYEGSHWEAKERPKGRTGPSAKNHCSNGNVFEQILDWRPFNYYTVNLNIGSQNVLVTGELKPTNAGTHLKWNIKLKSGWPRMISRQLCRRIVTHKWKLNDQFRTLSSLLNETQENVNTD